MGSDCCSDKPLSGFDAESHFVIKFKPDFEGGRPHGYNGAGVWLPNPEQANPSVWAPDPLLLGIETHGCIKSLVLRAVKSDLVRRFLEQVIEPADGGTGHGTEILA